MPNAGCPFASVGISRKSPAAWAGHWVATSWPMSPGERYQPVNGGISQTASALNRSTSAATSYFSKAATYRWSSSRCSGVVGSATSSSVGATWLICARARCSELFTAAVVVPSSTATSAARQFRTSLKMRTARCLGGRCCSAAMRASRMLSRDVTMVAGSPGPPPTMASGIGSSHGTSGCSASPAVGPVPGAPRAAAPALQRGQAGAGGDPVEPGPQGRPLLEPVVGAPGTQVGLLHQILGIVHRAEHPVTMREQLAPVRFRPGQELFLLDRAVRHLYDLSGALCLIDQAQDKNSSVYATGPPPRMPSAPADVER